MNWSMGIIKPLLEATVPLVVLTIAEEGLFVFWSLLSCKWSIAILDEKIYNYNTLDYGKYRKHIRTFDKTPVVVYVLNLRSENGVKCPSPSRALKCNSVAKIEICGWVNQRICRFMKFLLHPVSYPYSLPDHKSVS